MSCIYFFFLSFYVCSGLVLSGYSCQASGKLIKEHRQTLSAVPKRGGKNGRAGSLWWWILPVWQLSMPRLSRHSCFIIKSIIDPDIKQAAWLSVKIHAWFWRPEFQAVTTFLKSASNVLKEKLFKPTVILLSSIEVHRHKQWYNGSVIGLCFNALSICTFIFNIIPKEGWKICIYRIMTRSQQVRLMVEKYALVLVRFY